MSKLSRYTPAAVALVLAFVCVAWELARVPTHGLMLTKFAGTNFETQLGPPALDQKVYFSSADDFHPVPAWVRPHTSARWTGYFFAPRTGNYIFQLSTDDGGWLYIDDRLTVVIGGQHPAQTQSTGRFKLHQGFHKLRIDYNQVDGGAGMKLEWAIPTNWGAPVLTPVSMMYPEEPPPISLFDRFLRLAPWLLVVLAIALARRDRLVARARNIRTDAGSRRRFVAGALILTFALGVRLYDLRGAGETCDEGGYTLEGLIYAENISAGIFDADQWRENQEHPTVGKFVYGATHFVFGDAPGNVNAASAVLSALTVLTVFLTALRLFGLSTAISAGLILALFPSVIAHGKIASLECPATFFFTLAMYLYVRALHEDRGRNAMYGWLVFVTGLAIATKFTNGFLLPIIFVGLPLSQWKSIRATGRLEIPWTLYGFPFTPFIIVFCTWPWLWTSTGAHLNETLNHWGNPPADWFLGVYAPPPRIYFAAAFAAITPVALYLPFFIALAQIFRPRPGGLFRPFPEGCLLGPRLWWFFLIVWFITPFGWSFMSFRQDGIRYVYNAFPPFSILAGAGLVILGRFIRDQAARRSWERVSRFAVPALAGAMGLYLFVSDALIHPYYLDYFNEAVGGAKNVFQHRILETGWWGEGLDRTIPFVNQHAKPNATYAIKGLVNHTFQDLRDDLRRVDWGADFIISSDMAPNMRTPFGYDEVLAVNAGNAPIVRVYERKGLEDGAGGPTSNRAGMSPFRRAEIPGR